MQRPHARRNGEEEAGAGPRRRRAGRIEIGYLSEHIGYVVRRAQLAIFKDFIETMAPVDYHIIRISSLGRGSGQESPGFRKLLDVGRRLGPRFRDALARRSLTILDLEREPRRDDDAFRLLQAMMDYDEAFMKWRFSHMRLAFRIIGDKVLSLKGVPAAQLEAGTREPLFPELWAAISELTAEYKPTY